MNIDTGSNIFRKINYVHLRTICGCALLIVAASVIICIWVASVAVYYYPMIIDGHVEVGQSLTSYAIFMQQNVFSREPVAHALAVFLVVFYYPWEKLDRLMFSLIFFLPISLFSSTIAHVLIGYGLVDEKWGISRDFVRRRILPSALYVLVFVGILPTIVVLVSYKMEIITVLFVGFFSMFSLLVVFASVGLPFALAFALWRLRQGHGG